MSPPSPSIPVQETPLDPFNQWAETYDTQPNPLLMLEERTTSTFLPSIKNQDVLDIGCGTGRWLLRLQALSPASLTGTDPSPAMLERAHRKLAPATMLARSDASSLLRGNGSCNLVLASFVLSYIDDLDSFARECARVLRPGGHLLVSDMHPVTAARRGWTRSFKAGNDTIELRTHSRSLVEIIATFEDHGLRLDRSAEPPFASPERPFFEQAGKLAEYTSVASAPAIYVLRFRRPPAISASPQTQTSLQLLNAPWSTGPDSWTEGSILITEGRIAALNQPPRSTAPSIDLSGYAILPGLINSHDHLEFALFPNLGRSPHQPPFRNAAQWATEIHREHAPTIKAHRQVPLQTRLWWGAIRNLLSGVTTVCHHNPMHAELKHPGFPINVVSGFGWSHSLTFGGDVRQQFQATRSDQFFVIHAAEGTDQSSRDELLELDRLHILNHRTVLVHGLALTAGDIALLNRRRAALVLCPTSNRFLFGKTLSRHLLSGVRRLALGSDSPLTAAGDLLDEIACLRSAEAFDTSSLYRLVTSQPAAILHLQQGEGTIAISGRADLIAVRTARPNPADTLATLSLKDVELVIVSGRIQLASPAMYERLPRDLRGGLHRLTVAHHQRWLRAPLPHLFATADSVLGKNNLRLGGKQVYQ